MISVVINSVNEEFSIIHTDISAYPSLELSEKW